MHNNQMCQLNKDDRVTSALSDSIKRHLSATPTDQNLVDEKDSEKIATPVSQTSRSRSLTNEHPTYSTEKESVSTEIVSSPKMSGISETNILKKATGSNESIQSSLCVEEMCKTGKNIQLSDLLFDSSLWEIALVMSAFTSLALVIEMPGHLFVLCVLAGFIVYYAIRSLLRWIEDL